MREIAPGCRVIAVIKANAYGHGLLTAAEALAGADAFAVARVEEAVALREAGCRNRIVLLEGYRDRTELETAARHSLEPFVHQDWQLDLLEGWQGAESIRAWLKLDTGMHRLGFGPASAAAAARRLAACRKVLQPPGLATHLADSERADGETTRAQLSAFEAATAGLPGERCIANSAGLIAWPDARADWVRPGIMLYGISPFGDRTGADLGLAPVMTFETRVIALKDLAAGDSVGYGGTWIAPRASRVAVAAVGYGDGYPRSAPNGTPVAVNGRPAQLAGRPSMDMLTVDVTGLPGVSVGDRVELWGTRRARRARRGGGRHHRLRAHLPRRASGHVRDRVKVLVTGSSGRIGGAIAARLSLRHAVTGVDLKPGPLTTELADVADTTRIAGLLDGIDAVVHTASLHVPHLASRTAADFRSVNVDATRRLLAAAGDAGVGRFVYTSTTSLYGDAMLPEAGEAVWVTESLAPRPRDVYDETKLAAEEACAEAARAGLPAVALRMSRCFPEEPRLLAIYRLHRGVDAEDVAQAHELALAPGRTGFSVFNVSALTPFARADCRRLYEDAASVLLERHPWAAAEFARRGWQLPRSVDRVYVVERAIAELGYRPIHDFAALFPQAAH